MHVSNIGARIKSEKYPSLEKAGSFPNMNCENLTTLITTKSKK